MIRLDAPHLCRSLLLGALFMPAALLSSCIDTRNPSGLEHPDNRLFHLDRGAKGSVDTLKGGVNAYLWRGAIDTLSFMPLASADAQGGVILTDWYSPPHVSEERFKMAVYILDRRLRSDALKVVIFRQVRSSTKASAQWEDEPVADSTVADITTHILERARQLRAQNP